MTGSYAWINIAEAALWVAMAAVALFVAFGRARPSSFLTSRFGLLILAVTLAAFGASDVVETSTGAWWRPWWLLLWKSGCTIVLLAYVVTWMKGRAPRSDPRRPSSTRSA